MPRGATAMVLPSVYWPASSIDEQVEAAAEPVRRWRNPKRCRRSRSLVRSEEGCVAVVADHGSDGAPRARLLGHQRGVNSGLDDLVEQVRHDRV